MIQSGNMSVRKSEMALKDEVDMSIALVLKHVPGTDGSVNLVRGTHRAIVNIRIMVKKRIFSQMSP